MTSEDVKRRVLLLEVPLWGRFQSLICLFSSIISVFQTLFWHRAQSQSLLLEARKRSIVVHNEDHIRDSFHHLKIIANFTGRVGNISSNIKTGCIYSQIYIEVHFSVILSVYVEFIFDLCIEKLYTGFLINLV